MADYVRVAAANVTAFVTADTAAGALRVAAGSVVPFCSGPTGSLRVAGAAVVVFCSATAPATIIDEGSKTKLYSSVWINAKTETEPDGEDDFATQAIQSLVSDNQRNRVYSEAHSIPIGSEVEVNLRGGIWDVYGNTISMGHVSTVAVQNTGEVPISVGPASALGLTGFFSGSAARLYVQKNSAAIWDIQDMHPIDDSQSSFVIENPSADTAAECRVLVLGRRIA